MPIFIDELVIRGEVSPSIPSGTGHPPGPGSDMGPTDRQALVVEVTEAVIDHLERALERIGER